MDPNSGKIFKDIDAATALKHGLERIEPKDEEDVQLMNRHERRAWAAKQRAKRGER